MSTTAPLAPPRPAPARVPGPLPTRERRPSYVALGLILIVGGGFLGAWLYTSAGAKTPVVVMAPTATVPAGAPITRADLSTVSVAGGVNAIAGTNLDSLIGQTAAVTLLPDTLLQRSMLTSGEHLNAGKSEVGVAVTSGQIPADGLNAGDTVQVVQLPDTGASSGSGDPGSTAQELVPAAEVFAVRADPAQPGGTLLTLTVPATDAAAVATASGAGKVALIKVAVKQ